MIHSYVENCLENDRTEKIDIFVTSAEVFLVGITAQRDEGGGITARRDEGGGITARRDEGRCKHFSSWL